MMAAVDFSDFSQKHDAHACFSSLRVSELYLMVLTFETSIDVFIQEKFFPGTVSNVLQSHATPNKCVRQLENL